MDVEKLIEQLRTESLYVDKASLEIMDLCMDAATALAGPAETLPKWVRPESAMPPEDELVLANVSGRPCRHIRLVYAVELATWTLEEGWSLEEYPAYEDAEIHFWAPIPERPEEARV